VTYRMQKPLFKYHQYQGESQDCGPTSLAIAANACWEETRLEGGRVAEEMDHPVVHLLPYPRLVVYRIAGWATFPWGMVSYLRSGGIRARWRLFSRLEDLQSNLTSDLITLVTLGEPFLWDQGYRGWSHYKVLYAHQPGDGFLFVDPAHERDSGEEEGLSWQEEGEFLSLWRRMGRIRIEVEGVETG